MSTRVLSCKDLGNNKCDFTARGESREDVKRQMIEHATREHPDHRYGSDWEGTLGREIDDIMNDHAPAPATTEDASQGGEFLDDQVARDDARGQGGQARGTAAHDGRDVIPGGRVNVESDDRSGAGRASRDGMSERRAGDGLTPLEGEAEQGVVGEARRP